MQAMKQRLKDEYLGLGGAPNKVLPVIAHAINVACAAA